MLVGDVPIDGDSTMRRDRRLLAFVMVVALMLATASIIDSAQLDPGGAYVAQYQYTEDPATRLLTFGDGQFFGMIAEDPTLSRPEALLVHDDNGQFAYRAMRPAFAWAGALVAFGQPELIPWALVFLTVSSVAFLFSGVRRLTIALGRDPAVAAAVIVLPGVIRLLGWTGPEIAASACACFAVAAAVVGRGRRATAWLVGAVLLRETLVLVVAGLVLSRLLRFRYSVVPAMALGIWIGAIRFRLGVLPAGGSRFEVLGLTEIFDSWGSATWLAVLLLIGLTAIASWRSPVALALVVPHAALILTMSSATGALDDFGRILLPMYALLLPFASPTRGRPAVAGEDSAPTLTWHGTAGTFSRW